MNTESGVINLKLRPKAGKFLQQLDLMRIYSNGISKQQYGNFSGKDGDEPRDIY